MAAMGKHTIEADRKTTELANKRKRDKYGDRKGQDVLKRYKYDENASAPAEEEGKGEGDTFEGMDEGALMEALEAGSPEPFSNPHPPPRLSAAAEPDYSSTESVRTSRTQQHRGSARVKTSAIDQHDAQQKQVPSTPRPPQKSQQVMGGRRAVPQYDHDEAHTPSSPYTAASSSGPVTPKTPASIASSSSRSREQAKAARLAAINDSIAQIASQATIKTQQPAQRRRGGFKGQPQAQARIDVDDDDEFADDALDSVSLAQLKIGQGELIASCWLRSIALTMASASRTMTDGLHHPLQLP
jgi:hypothetical protein